MSVLTAIRKQENPDGIEGHNERQEMQEESNAGPRKKNYTRGRDFHYYTHHDWKRRSPKYDAVRIAFAREFCESLCLNTECPLNGRGCT